MKNVSENAMACVSANNNSSSSSGGGKKNPPHIDASAVHRDVQLQVKRANEQTDLAAFSHKRD